MTDPVLVDRRGPVAILRLNRPEKRNALDTAALALLDEVLTDLAADDEPARARLLDHEGHCAVRRRRRRRGTRPRGGRRPHGGFTRLYSWLDDFPVPIVAVAVGHCVGAGAEIVAGADLRVGANNLRLAWAGARLGVPVGPARLVPLIGVAAAKDLVLTGRTIGLAEARALGIVQREAFADDAEAVAIGVAEQLAAQHPDGIRVLKQMFRDLDGSARRVAYENELLMRFQDEGAGIPRVR